ncbi:MAG: universal stress protein [Bacteroidota bacterium]
MQNILVPVDFSEESAYALDLASQLVTRGDVNIILSHAIEIVNYTDNTPELDDTYKEKFLKTVLQKIDSFLIEAQVNIPDKSIKIEIDHPFSHILQLIEEEKIDLIVMGSKGHRNWKGVLIGSTTEKVIRHSTCPVLITKDKTEISKIKEISFATDLSNTPRWVIRALQELLQLLDARLHILKVITPNSWQTNREIKKQMQDFVKNYEFDNYSMNIYNDIDAGTGIVHYTEDINAGLIAIASHTKSDMSSVIHDYRVAERVVEGSQCLVWVCGLGDRLY